MGGAVEPFLVTNSAGGMQQHQPKQPVSDQRMQDQAVAMAIALADSGVQRQPEKTDSDAALALHLALNDSAERITFRGEPSGKCPASPPSAYSHVTSLSSVCNILNRHSHHGDRCDCRHNFRCGRGAVASSIRPVVLSSAGQALPQRLREGPCLPCAFDISVRFEVKG